MNRIGLIILGIVGALLLLLLFVFSSFISTKNQLVTRDEAVKTAWSDVDTQLQRRSDLIPNLVETVKGFAKQESGVFANIAAARTGLMNASTPKDKIAANGQLDAALAKVLVLTENYPQLRSNEQFMRLQDELAGTENRITVSRRRYNESLRDYNTFVRQFPNSIWAGMAGFQAKDDEYFKASEASRKVPGVKF